MKLLKKVVSTRAYCKGCGNHTPKGEYVLKTYGNREQHIVCAGCIVNTYEEVIKVIGFQEA